MSLVMRQSKSNQKSGRQSGFSLIEVSIALVVISVLAVPFMQQYNLYKINKITEESRGNLYVVKAALQKYAINYGRYPAPSDRNKASGFAGYGEETTIAPPYTAMPLCSVNNTTVCKTSAVAAAAVLIGTVPFSTIGLPEQYTLDGYKRRFTYAVTQQLTDTTTFTDNGGKIKLIDNRLVAGVRQNHKNTTVAGNVQFVLVSHGLNGKGAYTVDGLRPYPCTAAGTGDDIENCDDNKTFNSNYNDTQETPPEYKRFEFDVAGATYYDDYIEFSTSTSSDIWTMNAQAVNQDIYNRSSGDKVRIGMWGSGPLAGQTNPDAKVDVAGDSTEPGNVKVKNLLTNRLCTFSENAGVKAYVGCVSGGAGTPKNKVFTPSIIGGNVDPGDTKAETSGNGINCGAKGMTGIKNANELCSNYTPTTTFAIDASCVAGTGGVKFLGGKLYCGN